jgi:transposase
MTTKATRNTQAKTSEGPLFMSFELREKTWKLGFTTGPGQKPRERNMTARDHERVLDEIAQAKRRLGLPETAPVVSCYEAGREGFWLHRFLEAHGITNHVGWIPPPLKSAGVSAGPKAMGSTCASCCAC